MALLAKHIMHLNDLRVGESIVCGESARGVEEYGLLIESAPGCYLRVLRADNQSTCLFKDLYLLTNVDPKPYQLLKAQDSYKQDCCGFIAYPDLEFWQRLRIPAWFSMEPEQYAPDWDGSVAVEDIKNLTFLLEQRSNEMEREAIQYQLNYLKILYNAQASPDNEGSVT